MNYDSVTGLPSRESFLQHVETLFSQENSNQYAILAFQTTSYERIRHLYGDSHGNFLLSCIVQKFIRKQPYMSATYRFQNDTFVVLLSLSNLKNMTDLKRTLKKSFLEFTAYIATIYTEIPINLRGGVSLFLDPTKNHLDVINCAVSALQVLAESNSSDHIMFYEDALQSLNSLEHRILPIWENIWEKNHFIVYLQPILDSTTEHALGAEALVRIMDSNGHILKPNYFLPVLEKKLLSYELDLMVVENITRLIYDWICQDLVPVPICINLSSSTLCNNRFYSILLEIFEKYPDAASYLTFEIKSEAFTQFGNEIYDYLKRIRTLGCSISLDGIDSTYFYLNTWELPAVDIVKCDHEFLNVAMKTHQHMNHFHHFVEFCDDCNISVICSGIERQDEEKFVKTCKINYVQGYFYARPMPFDIFQKRYLEYNSTTTRNSLLSPLLKKEA